jgi:hypothetical protein
MIPAESVKDIAEKAYRLSRSAVEPYRIAGLVSRLLRHIIDIPNGAKGLRAA